MNLKLKRLFIALPIILLTACSSKNPEKEFEIKGKINNFQGENLYFEHLSPSGVDFLDTIKLNNKGEFDLKTDKVKSLGFYRIKITNSNFTTFIFSPGEKVEFTADIANLVETYTVKGSHESELLMDINKTTIRSFKQRDSLQKAFQTLVSSGASRTQMQNDSLSKDIDDKFNKAVNDYYAYLQNFVKVNNNTFASLAAIQQLPIEDYFSTYEKLDESLTKQFPESEYVKQFHASTVSRAASTVGATAPEISMNTPEGKPLALSSLKGKVVLVDFWASWCGPCRMENPNVVAAYNKYKDRGFDIFSVSLDNDLTRWKAAIQKDNLSWKNHVSDMNGWKSPVVQLYGFNGIPYNVLLDKEGKIIAKNLRGEALEKAISDIIK